MKLHSPNNPLKPGESGTSEFVPAEEGTYYYICTVPGHREQGMVGEIIVGPAQAVQLLQKQQLLQEFLITLH